MPYIEKITQTLVLLAAVCLVLIQISAPNPPFWWQLSLILLLGVSTGGAILGAIYLIWH